MNQERANDLEMMNGTLRWLIIIAIKVSQLRPKQKGILLCAQPQVELDTELSLIYMSLWQDI